MRGVPRGEDGSILGITKRLGARLGELARATRDEEDLRVPSRRFDGLMRYDELVGASRPGKNPRLEAMLAAVSRRVRGPGVSMVLVTPLLCVREERFWHGAASIGGSLAVFFYFEEHELGLLAVRAGGGMTEYVRFTAVDVPERAASTQRGPRGSA